MRLMSVRPLRVHQSKQALRFCTVEPSQLSSRRQRTGLYTTSLLFHSSTPRTTFACSQVTAQVIENTMTGTTHAQKAWEHWKKLGSPKFVVAPMVDQSELPFRMFCRKYGATAAYTPMLHARLFSEGSKYREEHLTTCPEDRPLFVQFCANDPDVLVNAAQHVEEIADYIDLNFGCPQRIAKKGHYGAFLMDDLPCVASLVQALHERTATPVSAKIRIFPELSRTLEYAKLIEASGASLVAVHGRTREQKDASAVRADWDAIKAVKEALTIPVLGNGDIQSRSDAVKMMQYTGVDGVLSASPVLEDPRLFWEQRSAGEPYTRLKCFEMAQEYLEMCDKYPVPMRMVRGHTHKIVGAWFQEHTDIRDEFTRPPTEFNVAFCKATVSKLEEAVRAVGREHPVPKISERKLARLAREEAISGAKKEQEREARALALLEKKRAAAAVDAEVRHGDRGDATRKTLDQAVGSKGPADAGSMGGVGGAAGGTLPVVALECSETFDSTTTNSRSDVDQHGASMQMVGGSRKQARLVSGATGVA